MSFTLWSFFWLREDEALSKFTDLITLFLRSSNLSGLDCVAYLKGIEKHNRRWSKQIRCLSNFQQCMLDFIGCNSLLYKHQWNNRIFAFTKKNRIFIARSEDTIFIFHTVKISFPFDKIFLLSL